MGKVQTRMGDGHRVEITEAELRGDLEAGTDDAADRAKIAPLTPDEIDYLFEIHICPDKVVSVEQGNEVCLTYDSCTTKLKRATISISKIQSLQVFERALGADSLELAHIDYSFKQVKPIVVFEQPILEQALLITIPPLLYGAMPNLGLYSQPDGPCPNPMDLLPLGKISEAKEAFEDAIEHAVKDMVYVGSQMYETGADGINFDTTAASGDPEFLAALRAVEILRKKYPKMGIEMGMASEFILGLHGDLYYDGVRLAGLYPHDQVKLAQKAGATLFGPAINIIPNKSLPFNLARSVTYTKACTAVSEIPIHAAVGMGVCGIPLAITPPVDALSRASKAHVEICRLDGLQVGVGDPYGMHAAHAIVSGMGGIRAAGDLVARLQLNRAMKIDPAKQYVADKLGVSVADLADPVAMRDVREEMDLGALNECPGVAKGIDAKFRIAHILDLEINCVELFKQRVKF